ncbi:2'-5' RNA ligase family protein [Rhizobium sp. NXC14]|uniref:2'-5' RNA ligase family protein n=1 Tax=Rhizobium sp. NXC14 TaxID=1981173 RepID=UPI000A26EFEA|nr:2'-5' RNA ligase family protein [Rhizobium sp. NXC14]
MPFGITLKCLNDTASPVFKNYPPHVTLAVYPEIAVDRLAEAAERVFRSRPAVTLSFSRIGSFENQFLVLWARPDHDEWLFQLHAALHREIEPVHCHEHYWPGNWVPHCTIAAKIPKARLQAAISWANRNRRQFSVTFDPADCVRFPPVDVLSEIRLASR